MSMFDVLRSRQSRRRGRDRQRQRALRRTARFEPLEGRLLLSAKPTGLDFKVSDWDLLGQNQDRPAVAIAPDGDFVVAWHAPRTSGGAYDIFFQLYDADGTPRFDTQQYATWGVHDCKNPDVAMDAAGNFVIVWTRERPPTDDDVFMRRYDSSGTALCVPTQVNQVDGNYPQRKAKVAMAQDGDFVVVWEHFRDASDWDIHHRFFGADGHGYEQMALVDVAGRNEHEPDVALGATIDHRVFVWTECPSGGGDRDVWYRYYDNAGYHYVTREQVNTTDGGHSQFEPSVAMDSWGNFTVVWTHGEAPENYDVYGQQFSFTGAKYMSESVVDDRAGIQHRPTVGMGRVQIVVAYEDAQAGNVFYRLYSDAGLFPRGPRRSIQHGRWISFAGMVRPSVAMNEDGEFVVGFGYSPSLPTVGTHTIRARNYRSDVETAGLYDPGGGTFHLKNVNANPPVGADLVFRYGPRGDRGWLPIAGDWDFSGTATVGLYDPAGGAFHLKNSNAGAGGADEVFRFGPRGSRGWIPIAGDFDGDGVDTVGLYDPGTGGWHLKNSHALGPADVVFRFGPSGNRGWIPIVADWFSRGVDTIGLYDPVAGVCHLKYYLSAGGGADRVFRFGPRDDRGWIAVAGDWNRDGVDTVGLYDPAAGGWHLKNSNLAGPPSVVFRYGPAHAGWIPLVGDWDGPGASPLMAAGGEAVGRDVDPLTQEQLQPIIAEAIAGWDAVGVDANFSGVELVITDLPGAMLGLAEADRIYIDHNAAGYGWFVDPTPGSDEEFSPAVPGGEQVAVDPEAVDRMDLLTVVSHELGHLLGLEDLDPSVGSLMSGTLETGLRREPGPAERDALFALL